MRKLIFYRVKLKKNVDELSIAGVVSAPALSAASGLNRSLASSLRALRLNS